MMINRSHIGCFMIGLLAILIFGGCGAGVQGGGGNTGLSWKNKLKIADKFYEEGYYYDAAHYYEEVLNDQPENVDVTYKLAESYFYSRDYKMANQNYKLVMEKNKELYPLSHYNYALTLKYNGKYPEAKKAFEDFIKNYRSYDAPIYKKKVKNEIIGCDYASKAMMEPLNVVVVHMGAEVNAAYTEASPMPFGEDKLLYASLRSDTLIRSENLKGKVARFKIYQSVKNGRKWSKGEPITNNVNLPKMDVANGVFTPDGLKFFYTMCEPNDAGALICAIYVSDYRDDTWTKGTKLNEEINMPDITSTQPAVAYDERRKSLILYYVTDRPDGEGGRDIWYTMISSKGVYKKPRSVGKKINTVGDEITPFFNASSHVLSFSSDGHPSMGGYDVFYSSGKQRKWTTPENAGFPINSRVDDMYFVADANEEGGYFVSNRVGTIALKSETCCDDIFRYTWDRDMIPKFGVDRFAYDVDDSLRATLTEYDLKLYQVDMDSSVILIDEKHITTEPEFFFTLKPNHNYKIEASKEGYFPNEEWASTIGLTRSDTLHRWIPLKKLDINSIIILKDIYYDFDKATLRPESNRTLKKLVQLLNVNPSIVVELGAHTDSKGEDAYNEKLSQRRAESVVKYLRKHGIPKDRLVAKGYGENTPIAENTNEDGSDNPAGRQMNRRTEIKVIGKTKVTVKKKAASIDDAFKDADNDDE